MISRIFFSIAGKSSGRERLVAEEVVIEAVLDHRPDGHLRAGPQRLHRFGQHMRGVVADQFERARVLAGDELDLRVLLDRVGEVGELAVERHRDRALGERGRDALRDVETGDAWRDIRGARRRGRSGRCCWRKRARLRAPAGSAMGHSCCSLPRTSVGKREFVRELLA